jgi:DNA-directed RNA polymerase specialized sigma24 family protein
MLRPASDEQWQRLGADVGRLVGGRVPTADVEDVVQEVLLRVWRHGAGLRDGERFGAWLSRVASTAAADHLRTKQRHPIPRHEASEEAAAADDERVLAIGELDAKALIAGFLRPFVDALPAIYLEAVAAEGYSRASSALGATPRPPQTPPAPPPSPGASSRPPLRR